MLIPDPNGMFSPLVGALGTGMGEASPELNGDLTALASCCMFQLGRNASSPVPVMGDDPG